MHTRAQRESQSSTNCIRSSDEFITQCAHPAPINMQTLLIRAFSAAPDNIGDRALRDDTEACGERMGNYIIQRLLVSDVDTQLDRAEVPGPDGPESCRPIPAI